MDKILENAEYRIQDTEYRMAETQDSKSVVIERPPKVYLDTNHLINVSKVRKGQRLQTSETEENYRHIDEYLKSYCALIFNPVATMDWVGGKATQQSIREIAAVIDSAKLKCTIPESDHLVYTYEVLEQCHKQNPSMRVPDLPPIFQNISDNCAIRSSLAILARDVPDYLEEGQNEKIREQGGLPTEIPVLSAGEWVKGIFNRRQANPEDYDKRISDFKNQLAYDIQNKDVYFCDSERYRRDWLKRLLKIDRILRAFNPGCDIDAILQKTDVEDCPAITLYWTVREKRMRSGVPPTANDVDDYGYIPVIPYADIVLIERQLREFVLQADKSLEAKVFSKVSDALNALESQRFAW